MHVLALLLDSVPSKLASLIPLAKAAAEGPKTAPKAAAVKADRLNVVGVVEAQRAVPLRAVLLGELFEKALAVETRTKRLAIENFILVARLVVLVDVFCIFRVHNL